MKARIPTPDATAALLRRTISSAPRLAIQLGTGFGGVAEAVEIRQQWSYRELPGFPVGSVPGHEGRLLMGALAGTPVWVLCGRAHFYEGFSMAEVTFAVRTLAAAGASTVLLTNAAGGIRKALRPGSFMVLSDHINGLGENPLRGPVPLGCPRFLDASAIYDPLLRRILRRAGRDAGVRCQEGVYLAVPGPSFETPAEIRAFRRFGADAVGMSTVPEALAARQRGLRVAALSAITNAAAGLGPPGAVLTHEEVLVQAAARGDAATRLVSGFARRLGVTD
ncbi:MAG: purine-nucleoside phosphorylase [Verrucomicrobia bacterium]|nr:purine-nucleoside phosphorylase [Verrucomicrobiota bacterium]